MKSNLIDIVIKHKVIVILGLAMIILGTALLCYGLVFKDKVAPNIYLGNAKLSGLTSEEAETKVKEISERLKLTVSFCEEEVVATTGSLGVAIDVKGVVKEAVGFKSPIDFLEKLNFARKKDIDLSLNMDVATAKTFFEEKFSNVLTTPVEPSVVYNSGKTEFEVVAGGVGRSVEDGQFETIASRLENEFISQKFDIKSKTTSPTVRDETASNAAQQATERIKVPYLFILDNKTVYTLSEQEKASMLSFAINNDEKTIGIAVNKDEIANVVDKKIARTVNRAGTRATVVEKDGALILTLKNGSEGCALANAKELKETIYQSLNGDDHTGNLIPLSVAATPMPKKVIDMNSATKWIDINISTQKLRLYIGDSIYQEFTVSTGKPSTPTPTGNWRVYLKYASKDMRGDDFFLKDVPYALFYDGNYAIHGAYWHNDFGTPVSHGCTNMRPEEARIVFDFAPIGTLVVVHY